MEHVTIPSPTLPPKTMALLSKINRFCREHEIRPTMFGREAVGSPGFIGALMRGRVPRRDTIAKVEAFMASARSRISPAKTPSEPFASIPLPQEVQSALALHGLRELLFAPIPVLAEALAHLDRDQLGQAIEVMIAMLDASDGDPDDEAEDPAGETVTIIDDPDLPPEEGEGDPDLEETGTEDGFVEHHVDGPGCPVSDPGGAGADEDEERDGTDEGDISWTEWHTRGRYKDNPGTARKFGQLIPEDAEEDDPREDDDPREEDDHSGDVATDDSPGGFMLASVGEGAGCPLSDGDYDNPSDYRHRTKYRRHIQRTRCFPRYRYYGQIRSGGVARPVRELARYVLRHEPIVPGGRSLLRRKRGVPKQPRA